MKIRCIHRYDLKRHDEYDETGRVLALIILVAGGLYFFTSRLDDDALNAGNTNTTSGMRVEENVVVAIEGSTQTTAIGREPVADVFIWRMPRIPRGFARG